MRTPAILTAVLCAALVLACSPRPPEPQPQAVPPAEAPPEAPPEKAPEPSAPPPVVVEATSGLPPPAQVCVEQEGGALVPGTAEPSRAGVYDPSMPIVPEHLNWMVEGLGCVTYPGRATRTASCASAAEPAPVVTRTLCAQ
jgi:hypothetical protein